MQKTERYIISFCGGENMNDVDSIFKSWLKNTELIFLETGIYVEAILDGQYEICKTAKCDQKDTCIRLIAIRRPDCCGPDEYKEVLSKIFIQMRSNYPESYSILEMQEVWIAGFVPEKELEQKE
ncbi:hypothetical protein ACTQ6A_12185 [Lachnospiraceae bacterium LCP25S3_G4]